MNIIHNSKPSQEAALVLNALQKAVTNELEKKERLGQYAVFWDGEKAIETTKPYSN